MNRADSYRKKILNKLIAEGVQENNRINFKIDGASGLYSEVITLDEIVEITDNFKTHSSVNEFLNELVYSRISNVISEFGVRINESELDLTTTNSYDGYELNIPLINENYDPIIELFNEIDQELQQKNNASNVPITKEPYGQKVPNLPQLAKKQKTQNPKRVDLLIKSVFEDKFSNYQMKTDAGKWKVIKTLKKDGKLMVTFESTIEQSIIIECLFFPNDSNKIIVEVKKRSGEVLADTFFEIYRIPTDTIIAEKFFRKTVFSLLKKFIDTTVIQLTPFNKDFIFWKTDNPSFSYSFSTPNKNKIILDLINFISTAKKPILDDFFAANNLKHKQGYLQTLLDSAESAGIFRFKREGNEILIIRGPNYKAFLEGRVRRVVT